MFVRYLAFINPCSDGNFSFDHGKIIRPKVYTVSINDPVRHGSEEVL